MAGQSVESRLDEIESSLRYIEQRSSEPHIATAFFMSSGGSNKKTLYPAYDLDTAIALVNSLLDVLVYHDMCNKGILD